MSKQEQENSLKQEFYNRAKKISDDLNKQLLTLSTGIIVALFYLIYEKKVCLTFGEKIQLLITVFLFGFSILSLIVAMHWDASRNFF